MKTWITTFRCPQLRNSFLWQQENKIHYSVPYVVNDFVNTSSKVHTGNGFSYWGRVHEWWRLMTLPPGPCFVSVPVASSSRYKVPQSVSPISVQHCRVCADTCTGFSSTSHINRQLTKEMIQLLVRLSWNHSKPVCFVLLDLLRFFFLFCSHDGTLGS